MTFSFISADSGFSQSIGFDVPLADRLLCGSVCGSSIKRTRRSPQTGLPPNAVQRTPVINDASISCPLGSGLVLPIVLPAEFTAVAILRNHLRPIGGLLPIVGDFGPGTTGPQYVNGTGLGIQGAAGHQSVVAFYQNATGTTQGAFLNIEPQNGGLPSFLAATITNTTTRVHAGIGGLLQTAEVAVSGRAPSGWANKPAFAGTDARVNGDPGVDAAYVPELYSYFLFTPLSTSEVGQVMNAIRDAVVRATSLPMN